VTSVEHEVGVTSVEHEVGVTSVEHEVGVTSVELEVGVTSVELEVGVHSIEDQGQRAASRTTRGREAVEDEAGRGARKGLWAYRDSAQMIEGRGIATQGEMSLGEAEINPSGGVTQILGPDSGILGVTQNLGPKSGLGGRPRGLRRTDGRASVADLRVSEPASPACPLGRTTCNG